MKIKKRQIFAKTNQKFAIKIVYNFLTEFFNELKISFDLRWLKILV